MALPFVDPNPPKNFLLRLMELFDPTKRGTFDIFGGNDPSVMNANSMMDETLPPIQPQARPIGQQFGQIATNPPIRNQPSTLRKIGAAISGMGAQDPISGIQAAEQFAYQPYYRELDDWALRTDTLGKAAQEERLGGQADWTRAYQTGQQDIARQELDYQERNRLSRVQNEEVEADIANRRLRLDEFRATNPDHQFKVGADGMIYALNPQNPTKIINTKLKTTDLTPAQMETMKFNNSMAELMQRHQNALELAETRERNIRTRPARTSTSGDNELEIARARENRLAELPILHPEWVKFIKYDEAGENVTVVEPGDPGGTNIPFFGTVWETERPTQQQYDAIQQFLLGGRTDQTQTQTNQSNRIKVIGPNGETGTVDASEASSLPEGWKVVK